MLVTATLLAHEKHNTECIYELIPPQRDRLGERGVKRPYWPDHLAIKRRVSSLSTDHRKTAFTRLGWEEAE